MHINDWSAIQTLFDKLNKQVEKAQKVTETLGAPRVYVKMLVELEVRPALRRPALQCGLICVPSVQVYVYPLSRTNVSALCCVGEKPKENCFSRGLA
jgi:hypothetical protein